MKLTDLTRFKKLMGLTTSANDHEALAALRAANALLAGYGYTWERVLARSIAVGVVVEEAPRGTDDRDLADAFAMALERARGGFADVLADIHAQWERTGTLSPRQRAVVMAAAEAGEGRR